MAKFLPRATLAALGLLLGAVLPATPQGVVPYPQTLPANTVVCRLGIPAEGGPSQACPFSVLAAKIAGSGVAKMWPQTGQVSSPTSPWNAVDPFGNAISCAGTQSQCLQEFINATASNGWPAELHCQGNVGTPTSSEPVFISSAVGITVPAAQDWSFIADATCNLTVSVSSSSALTLDSEGASRFIWDGKIVYAPTSPNGNTTTNPSCVVYLNPHTNTADGFAGIYAGMVRIKALVAGPISGTTTGVVCMNTAVGSILQTRLDFTEINAGNAAYHGVFIFGAAAQTGFMQTEIDVEQIHGPVTDGINEGQSATNQGNNAGILWRLGNVETNAGRGVDTYGSNDIWDVGVINGAQGALATGIYAESGANNNKFTYGLISGATTAAYSDNGTCNSFWGPQGTQIAFGGTTSGCGKITGGTTGTNGGVVGTTTNDNALPGVVGEYMVSACPNQTATVTITIASPAVIAWTGHGYSDTIPHADACPIVFTTSGSLPTGLTAGTATYWVIPSSITTNTFEVATSVANALAGTAVTTTGTQSGTQTGTAQAVLTTSTPKNITGLALTAGDWDCGGVQGDLPAGSTVVSTVAAAVNTTPDTLPSLTATGAFAESGYTLTGTGRNTSVPPGRFSLSATTNVYFVGDANFTTAAENDYGIMRCRRVR